MLSKTLTQNLVVLDQLESISRHWGKKNGKKARLIISAECVAIKSLTPPGNVTGDVNWTLSENNYFLLHAVLKAGSRRLPHTSTTFPAIGKHRF